MPHTLEVYHQNQMIFHSDQHWLYPLLELESFLHRSPHAPAGLLVKDKVVGKAAAIFLVYLGIGQVEAELISHLGQETLNFHRIPFKFHARVERIYCQTEELLQEVTDLSTGYRLVKERILRAKLPG